MFLHDTANDEVNKVIDKLEGNTSCGVDETSRKVVKRLVPLYQYHCLIFSM